MKFISMGNEGYSIKFEESDTVTEKRIIKQGCDFIRNLLLRFNEIDDVRFNEIDEKNYKSGDDK